MNHGEVTVMKKRICHYGGPLVLLIGYMTAILLCPTRAVGIPCPDGWDCQTKTYLQHYDVSACGATLTNTLDSDTLCSMPIPGNVKIYVTKARFDDKGTLGGIASGTTGSTNTSCESTWLNGFDDVYLPPSVITIANNHLSVPITATDDPWCCGWFGWYDVSVTWMVKTNGCTSCGFAASVPGTSETTLGSMDFVIGLGQAGVGQAAGQLTIESKQPSLLLAKPDGLAAAVDQSIDVVTTNGVPRQVRARQALVDIVISNDYLYTLNFYTPANFSTNKTGGLYPLTGSPYQTITVENPDASTNMYNRLRISEAGDLGARQSMYVWDATDSQWELTTGGGLRKETRSEPLSGSSVQSITNTVWNPDGTVAFKKIDTQQLFTFGTYLISRVVDPDGASPQTNLWMYYTDQANDGNSYGQLKMMVSPTGYWETYQYDSLSRIIKRVAQFGDAATNAVDGLCDVTTYTYTTDYQTVSTTTTIETLLGWEIARSYAVTMPGQTQVERCQFVGAAQGDPRNLVTTTLLSTNGLFTGLPHAINNSDGTITIIDYSASADGAGKSTVTMTGVPDEFGDSVTDGTRTITITDIAGNVLTNQVYDIASNLLISQDIATQTDQFGRPTTVVHLDGTNTISYSCCGINSQTDQVGIQTTYSYDALKRVASTARAGITTTNVYDAAGRVLRTVRNGIQVSTASYDVAGRQTSSVDALTNSTSFSESYDTSGHLVRTTTYPNGATRIETYFKDGKLLSITGTAVHGVRYEYGVDANGQFTKQFKLNMDGSDSAEWTRTYQDMVGRVYKTVYADGVSTHISRMSFTSRRR